MKFRRVGSRETAIYFAEQGFIDDNVLFPVKPSNIEGGFTEFGYRMRPTGSDDIIGGDVVLHNEVDRFDEIAGKTKISPDRNIAETKFAVEKDGLATLVQLSRFSQPHGSRGGGMGYFL